MSIGEFATGEAALRDAIVIGTAGKLTPLISHRVTARGVETFGVKA